MEARIVGVTELQRHCRRVIDEVVHQGRPVILTRGSRPEAVIVPYEDYLRERQEKERDVLERVDRMLERVASRNSMLSEDEATEIALAEVHAVREARRRYRTGTTEDGQESAG